MIWFTVAESTVHCTYKLNENIQFNNMLVLIYFGDENPVRIIHIDYWGDDVWFLKMISEHHKSVT